MCTWWGDIGQIANTSDTSVIGDVVGFDILPGSDDVYNSKTGKWEKLAERAELRAELRLSRLGRLCHGPGRQRRQEAEGGLERGGPSRRQGPVAVDRDVSVGLPGASRRATSTSPNGSAPATTRSTSPPTSTRSPAPTTTRTARSSRASPASSSTTASPRTNWPRSSPARSTRAGGRRHHRRGLGEDHRHDRPREADRALQGLAGLVRLGPAISAARRRLAAGDGAAQPSTTPGHCGWPV